jgi:hypothetical protein
LDRSDQSDSGVKFASQLLCLQQSTSNGHVSQTDSFSSHKCSRGVCLCLHHEYEAITHWTVASPPQSGRSCPSQCGMSDSVESFWKLDFRSCGRYFSQLGKGRKLCGLSRMHNPRHEICALSLRSWTMIHMGGFFCDF